MPITRELLSEKLRKGTNGIYWLMEHFYTHDDDYKLVSFKPYATLRRWHEWISAKFNQVPKRRIMK